jgi:hypothetical protein
MARLNLVALLSSFEKLAVSQDSKLVLQLGWRKLELLRQLRLDGLPLALM